MCIYSMEQLLNDFGFNTKNKFQIKPDETETPSRTHDVTFNVR